MNNLSGEKMSRLVGAGSAQSEQMGMTINANQPARHSAQCQRERGLGYGG